MICGMHVSYIGREDVNVTTYSEDRKVDCHDHHRRDERERCNDHANEASDKTPTRDYGCDECQCACDGVEDECVREIVDRCSTGGVEAAAIDLAHNHRRLVADRLREAEVLISRIRRDIENAMSEAAECD